MPIAPCWSTWPATAWLRRAATRRILSRATIAAAGPDDVALFGATTSLMVDETVDHDPITGQSLQSAIPVRVTAVAAADVGVAI